MKLALRMSSSEGRTGYVWLAKAAAEKRGTGAFSTTEPSSTASREVEGPRCIPAPPNTEIEICETHRMFFT